MLFRFPISRIVEDVEEGVIEAEAPVKSAKDPVETAVEFVIVTVTT
jgi:hypothetical protein